MVDHVLCLCDVLLCSAVDYLSVVVRVSNQDDVPAVCAANADQREAIKHALIHSFSLIQAPPGTGSTLTAVRLAGLFVRINHSLPAEFEKHNIRPQLMICGPSDKSVDVIAGELSH